MFEIINFKKFSDGRGDLIPIELGSDFYNSQIPFDVKRIYYISCPSNEDNAVRGKHAHYNLEQVIICANGSCTIDMENLRGSKKSLLLKENNKGVYIKKGLIWRELKNFSDNCVVIVLASEHYDRKDYIDNYEKFKNL